MGDFVSFRKQKRVNTQEQINNSLSELLDYLYKGLDYELRMDMS